MTRIGSEYCERLGWMAQKAENDSDGLNFGKFAVDSDGLGRTGREQLGPHVPGRTRTGARLRARPVSLRDPSEPRWTRKKCGGPGRTRTDSDGLGLTRTDSEGHQAAGPDGVVALAEKKGAVAPERLGVPGVCVCVCGCGCVCACACVCDVKACI